MSKTRESPVIDVERMMLVATWIDTAEAIFGRFTVDTLETGKLDPMADEVIETEHALVKALDWIRDLKEAK